MSCLSFGMFNGSSQRLTDSVSSELIDKVSERRAPTAGASKSVYAVKDEYMGKV